MAPTSLDTGSEWQALQQEVRTVAKVGSHKASLEKDLQSLPVAGVHKKRRQAIDRLVHPGFEVEQGQFVVTVEHTQSAVCFGLNVDVAARFKGVAGGV